MMRVFRRFFISLLPVFFLPGRGFATLQMHEVMSWITKNATLLGL